MKIQFPTIAIVGTGAMGRGIAQIAAQAGSQVFLLDANPGAADAAQAALQEQWNKLVAKGRIDATQASELVARLHPVKAVADLAGCDLVVEAIVERLDVKKALFAELEAVVRPDAVLATNTSSLSVTAIGAGLQRPERLAGFHFFNPVPLMKVVEVIAGLKTDAAVCTALYDYAKQMGHTPVQAQDTPGFIVNHAGLPGARDVETLRAWRAAMRQLVPCSNILVKVSGIGVCGEAWTVEQQAPVVDALIADFGVERCLFASNYPVDALVVGLDALWNGFKALTRKLIPEQRLALFCDNATALYGLR